MNKRNFGKKQGFTIIELMIVLVIVAILLALAYPSYVDYVRKGKRGEAQQILMNAAVNLEIYRSNNPDYDNQAVVPADGSVDNYNFTLTGANANSYLLTAIAQGDQTNDKARNGTLCQQMTLNQNGVKGPAACWD